MRLFAKKQGEQATEAKPNLVDLSLIDVKHKEYPGRLTRCVKLAKKHINANLTGGEFLEIGAQHNQVQKYFPQFNYSTMDIRKTADNVIVGDITNCPQIKSRTFDVVFSLDVFEHINKPWLAAQEIERILKFGGIVYVSTLFSWRYHPCPIDYWRFSPDALESLFPNLRTLHKGWDYVERRVNSLRGSTLKIQDELGGWRENVRVNYVGIKK